MHIGVLALVGLAPERVAALTAAGYAVREGKKYANRIDAVRGTLYTGLCWQNQRKPGNNAIICVRRNATVRRRGNAIVCI